MANSVIFYKKHPSTVSIKSYSFRNIIDMRNLLNAAYNEIKNEEKISVSAHHKDKSKPTLINCVR